MDQELKAKWVKALRSGEYEQGKTFLRGNGKHCCLGVLCEVAGISITDDGCNTIIDGKESGYAALRGFVPQDQIQRLYGMNDCDDKSFPEIADYIESNL